MTQHKLIFEAVKEERIISQLRRCVLPVGSMFEGSHIAECPSDGGISQEMDFMLILPDVTASEIKKRWSFAVLFNRRAQSRLCQFESAGCYTHYAGGHTRYAGYN